MQPSAIVKDLNILKDFDSGFSSGFKSATVHEFCLQGLKKALHWGIIPAITFAAH